MRVLQENERYAINRSQGILNELRKQLLQKEKNIQKITNLYQLLLSRSRVAYLEVAKIDYQPNEIEGLAFLSRPDPLSLVTMSPRYVFAQPKGNNIGTFLVYDASYSADKKVELTLRNSTNEVILFEDSPTIGLEDAMLVLELSKNSKKSRPKEDDGELDEKSNFEGINTRRNFPLLLRIEEWLKVYNMNNPTTLDLILQKIEEEKVNSNIGTAAAIAFEELKVEKSQSEFCIKTGVNYHTIQKGRKIIRESRIRRGIDLGPYAQKR